MSTLHTVRTTSRVPLSRPRHVLQKSVQGFAILEALIALLIFALAVLGLVGLQASMTRASSGAKYRADAAYLATDLIGTMWTDSSNLMRYSSCSDHPPCQAWLQRVSDKLPNGTGKAVISGDQAGQVTVQVNWQLPSDGRHTFETTTAIQTNAASAGTPPPSAQ